MRSSPHTQRRSTSAAGLAGGARDVSRLEPQVCFHFLYVFYTTDVMNGQCRSMMANASQRRPSKANSSSSRGGGSRRVASRAPGMFFLNCFFKSTDEFYLQVLLQAYASPHKPTKANEGPRRPTKTHEGPRRPTQAQR